MYKNIKAKDKVYLVSVNEEESSYEVVFLNSDNDIDKAFTLCRGSDFGIIGEIYDISNQPSLEIEINNRNLFYQPFINFLQDRDEDYIDDEETSEEYGKRVTIGRNGDIIKLTFSYTQIDHFGSFSIHIKNTQQDPRSLIDKQGKNTKSRIHTLVNELYDVFAQYKDDDYIDEDKIDEAKKREKGEVNH